MGGLAPRRWPLPTSAELVRLCPIDGELSARHRPVRRTTDDLRSRAVHLDEALNAVGDREWAKLFETALPAEDDQFLVLMGHSLAVLLRRGPVSDIDVPRDDLEQLLVDVVGMWNPRSTE